MADQEKPIGQIDGDSRGFLKVQGGPIECHSFSHQQGRG